MTPTDAVDYSHLVTKFRGGPICSFEIILLKISADVA